MSLLDWLIVACLVVGAVQGLRRGLLRSILGLAGLIVGLILASQFYRPLATYLELHSSVISRMAAGIAPHLPLAAPVASAPAASGEALGAAIHGMGLPELISRYLVSASVSASLPVGTTVGGAIATLLASSVVGVLCFAGIFFATQIVTLIVAGLIAGAISVTPLGLLDHVAGLAIGAAYAAVGVVLLVGALSLLAGMPAFAFVKPALDRSTLAPAFIATFQLLLPRVPEWLRLG